MNQDEKRRLRQRFAFACGYCGTSEIDTGSTLTVDHFRPISLGGADDQNNWVYACFMCNIFKGDYWPATSADFALLNPLVADLSQHLELQPDGTLHALNPRAQHHIQRLRLNRPELVTKRLRDSQLAQQSEETAQLHSRIEDLETRLARAIRRLRENE